MRVIDRGGLPVHRLENCPNKRVPRDKRMVIKVLCTDYNYSGTNFKSRIDGLRYLRYSDEWRQHPCTVNSVLVVDELVSSLSAVHKADSYECVIS